MPAPILQSVLTCPECAHGRAEQMPTNACQWFYECVNCGVFCSYRSVGCPPAQVTATTICCCGSG
jgi:hypothetical protein